MLVNQEYGGIDDFNNHFNFLVEAFSDDRYVKINGKPLLHIYDPKGIPECRKYMDYWRELSLKHGFKGLHIVGENINIEEKELYGVDATTRSYHREIQNGNFQNKYLRWLNRNILRIPGSLKVYDYKDAMKYFVRKNPMPLNEYPCIVPNWDTTARLGKDAVILKGSTPKLFEIHLNEVFDSIKDKPSDDKIVYLKSWNEWAEGNYIEPDRKFGREYLETLKKVLKNLDH